MEKIAAGIVLYEPNLECLLKNIEVLSKQVEYVIIVDNASKNAREVEVAIKNVLVEKEYSYIFNSRNLGIAKALNQIVIQAEKEKYQWILTLDQDSICPTNMIEEYKKYLLLERVGMLTPIISDRNLQEEKQKKEIKQVKRCITSGSLLNVEAWNQISGFNEKLFIDYVDFEYNIRMQEAGYKIYSIGTVTLSHQLGNSQMVMFRGKKMITTNHPALRRYYNARNRVYCAKKYKKYIGRRDTIRYLKDAILLIAKFENKKFEKIIAIMLGSIVGIFMK